MASTQPTKTKARKDPPPKMLDGTMSFFTLVDQRPDQVYAFVFKGSVSSMARYRMKGYQPMIYTGPDTPRPVSGVFREGQEVEVADHVLMYLDRESYDEQRAAETAQADLIMDRIHGPASGGSVDSPSALSASGGRGLNVVPYEAD